MKDTSIAIVGMAGRFPGAHNVNEFWQNLKNGVEAIRPFTDAQLLAAGVSAEELAQPEYVKSGVVLEDLDMFDAAFFGFLLVPTLEEGEFWRRGLKGKRPAMHPLDLALVGQCFEIAPGSSLAYGKFFHNVCHCNALALGDHLQKLDLAVGTGNEVVLHVCLYSIIISRKMSKPIIFYAGLWRITRGNILVLLIHLPMGVVWSGIKPAVV